MTPQTPRNASHGSCNHSYCHNVGSGRDETTTALQVIRHRLLLKDAVVVSRLFSLSCAAGRVPKPERRGGCRDRTSNSEGANWSGRPRRLLAPAPPEDPDVRDYRIRLRGSQVHCSCSPIRYPLKLRLHRTRAQCLVVFPLNDSVIRHSASLHRLPRAAVRQLRRYYQSAPTSHRPSRVALFRSLSGTTDYCESRGSGELPFADSSSKLRRCLNPLPSTRTRGNDGISQVPRQPLCEHALLFDPGGPDTSGHKTYPILPSARLTASAPRSVTFRGSITQPARSLSTLHGSDFSDSNTA